MKIAWSIKLPNNSKLKVKTGDSVDSGDVIYEYHQSVIERLPLIGWQKLNLGDRKRILNNILKRNLTEGEVLGKAGWFSNLIIKSPGKGRCLGVDEFGNIELETGEDETYLAPVSAKKIRVEEERVIFELKGVEFECEGISQAKAWGKFDGLVVEDLDQIKNNNSNQVVIVKNSLETAVKSEAIGVAGLVLVDVDKSKEFEESDIPVVSMSEEDADKLVKLGESKIWLNATAGKVLVVLE